MFSTAAYSQHSTQLGLFLSPFCVSLSTDIRPSVCLVYHCDCRGDWLRRQSPRVNGPLGCSFALTVATQHFCFQKAQISQNIPQTMMLTRNIGLYNTASRYRKSCHTRRATRGSFHTVALRGGAGRIGRQYGDGGKEWGARHLEDLGRQNCSPPITDVATPLKVCHTGILFVFI